MKRILLALTGAILFSSLCFDREIGLNLFLLALGTTTILALSQSPRSFPWFYLGAYLYTAFFSFLQPGPGPVLMHLASGTALAGALAAGRKANIYMLGLVGGTNLVLGMLIGFLTGRRHSGDQPSRQLQTFAGILGGVLISGFLVFLFTSLYGESNPLFEAWVDRIDLGFLSLGRLWFTLLGFLLYFNLLHPYNPEQMLRVDENLPDALQAPDSDRTPDASMENGRLQRLRLEDLWGKMALASLDALLLLYLVLDWIFLAGQQDLSPASQSAAVHSGIYALILSIILAMGVLLLLFRGRLNFFAGNQWLLRLSMAWLVLNSLLLVNALTKNAIYVNASGLTYKRLGVFLFLVLCAIGLISVFIKIRQKKTLAYLVRRNSMAAFMVLVALVPLPWTNWITAYNLNRLDNPDLEYLLSLPGENSPQLYRYSAEYPDHISMELKNRIIDRNMKYHANEEAKDWREWTGNYLIHGGSVPRQ